MKKKGLYYSPIPVGQTPVQDNGDVTGLNTLSGFLRPMHVRDLEVIHALGVNLVRLSGAGWHEWDESLDVINMLYDKYNISVIMSFSFAPYMEDAAGYKNDWFMDVLSGFKEFWDHFSAHRAVYGIALDDVTDDLISGAEPIQHRVKPALSSMIDYAVTHRPSLASSEHYTLIIVPITIVNFVDNNMLQLLQDLSFDVWIFNLGNVPMDSFNDTLKTVPYSDKQVLISVSASAWRGNRGVNETQQAAEVSLQLNCLEAFGLNYSNFIGAIFHEYTDQLWRSSTTSGCLLPMRAFSQSDCGVGLKPDFIEYNGITRQTNGFFGEHCIVPRKAYYVIASHFSTNSPFMMAESLPHCTSYIDVYFGSVFIWIGYSAVVLSSILMLICCGWRKHRREARRKETVKGKGKKTVKGSENKEQAEPLLTEVNESQAANEPYANEPQASEVQASQAPARQEVQASQAHARQEVQANELQANKVQVNQAEIAPQSRQQPVDEKKEYEEPLLWDLNSGKVRICLSRQKNQAQTRADKLNLKQMLSDVKQKVNELVTAEVLVIQRLLKEESAAPCFPHAIKVIHEVHFRAYNKWCKERDVTSQCDEKNVIIEVYVLRLIHTLCKLKSVCDSFVCWNMHRFLLRLNKYQMNAIALQENRIPCVTLYYSDLHHGLSQIDIKRETKLRKGVVRINFYDLDMWARIDSPKDDKDDTLRSVKKYYKESPSIFVWVDAWRDYDFFLWIQFVIFTTGTACSFLLVPDVYPDESERWSPLLFLADCALWESRVWCFVETILLFHSMWQSRCLGGCREYAVVFRLWAFVISWGWAICLLLHELQVYPFDEINELVDEDQEDYFVAVIRVVSQYTVRLVLWRLIPTLLVGAAHRLKLKCCRSSAKPLSVFLSEENEQLPMCCLLRPRNHVFWSLILLLQFGAVTLFLSQIYVPLRPYRLCKPECFSSDHTTIMSLQSFSPACASCCIGIVSVWSASVFFSCANFSMLFYLLIACTSQIRGLQKGRQKRKAIEGLDTEGVKVFWNDLKYVYRSSSVIYSLWEACIQDLRDRDMISNQEQRDLTTPFNHFIRGEAPTQEMPFPKLPEARKQLSEFISSIKYLRKHYSSDVLRRAAIPNNSGRLSILIKVFREPVCAPIESLFSLLKDYPLEWAHFLERREVAEVVMLKEINDEKNTDSGSPYVRSASIWVSRRLETVERTILGALQTHRAFRILNGNANAEVEIIIGFQTYAEYYPSETSERKNPRQSNIMNNKRQDEINLFLANRKQLHNLMVRVDSQTQSICVVFPWQTMLKKDVDMQCWSCYREDYELIKAFLKEEPKGHYTVTVKQDRKRLRIVSVVSCEYGLTLGEGNHMTQAKAGLEIQMLRMVSGHFLQIYDANMDCTCLESAKLPFVLASFFPEKDGDEDDEKEEEKKDDEKEEKKQPSRRKPTLTLEEVHMMNEQKQTRDKKKILHRALRRCASVSFPKQIYTIHNGFVGRAVAVIDHVFSQTQRSFHMLGVQRHVGHPDVFDASHFYFGNFSKASDINLATSVMKGVEARIRGARDKFVDFIVGFKGRESTLVASSIYLVRLSLGACAALRSRDMQCFNVMQGRDCTRGFDCGITRMFALFQSGPGWYFYHVLVNWTIQLYVFSLLMFAFADVSPYSVGSSLDTLANPWALDVAMVLAIPLICKHIEDRGIASAIIPSLKDSIIAGVLFIFQNQTIAYAFIRSSITGEVTYTATGRRCYLEPHTKAEAMKQYLHSHYIPAFHICWQYIVYLIYIQEFTVRPFLLVVFTAGVWISVPVLFVHEAKASEWMWIKSDIKHAWKYALEGEATSDQLTKDLKRWARDRHPDIWTAFMSFGMSLVVLGVVLLTFPAIAYTQCLYALVFVIPFHFMWTFLWRLLAGTYWTEIFAGLWLLFGFLAGPLTSYCSPEWCLDLSWSLGAGVMLVCAGDVCYRFFVIVLFAWHKCLCPKQAPFSEDENGSKNENNKKNQCKCSTAAEVLYFVFLTFYVEFFVAIAVLFYQTLLQFFWFIICVTTKGILRRLGIERSQAAAVVHPIPSLQTYNPQVPSWRGFSQGMSDSRLENFLY